MGVRSRARSSANNPYVRHHKVSPSPHPHVKTSNSIYIERLPFVWKIWKFRGEFKWNGSTRWKIFRKKRNTFRGITFFPFSPRRPKFSVPFVCSVKMVSAHKVIWKLEIIIVSNRKYLSSKFSSIVGYKRLLRICGYFFLVPTSQFYYSSSHYRKLSDTPFLNIINI